MQGVLVSQIEQPAPVVLRALEHDRHRLLDSHIGCPQVLERAEHVVVPEGRKREDVDSSIRSRPT